MSLFFFVYILTFRWHFDKYIDQTNKSVYDEVFAYPEWIKFYYKWTKFCNYDLVIRVGVFFHCLDGSLLACGVNTVVSLGRGLPPVEGMAIAPNQVNAGSLLQLS